MTQKKTHHKAAEKEFAPWQKVIKQTVEFAREKPWVLAAIVTGVILTLTWGVEYLRATEVLPETAEMKAQKPQVFKKTDTLVWLGMEIAPVSPMLRKEFKIPGRIKGMFVVDQGTQEAFRNGVKMGDVIVSLNRHPVRNSREFVDAAQNTRFTNGILLDVFRGKENLYITVPFEYQYGPLFGPNKGTWQLGSPVLGQAFQYGPVVK
ncbi:MAG: hypothetical protein WCO69_00505 [Candidatus Omnitrophota bacterium]